MLPGNMRAIMALSQVTQQSRHNQEQHSEREAAYEDKRKWVSLD